MKNQNDWLIKADSPIELCENSKKCKFYDYYYIKKNE